MATKEHREHKEHKEMNLFPLCDKIRDTAYEVRQYHGNGHLEKIYENALAHRLKKIGIKAIQQHPLTVKDEDGTVLGNYFADLFIENILIIELKACRAIAPEHKAQVMGYMRSANIRHGLLINFGGEKFEMKKYIL